MRLTREQLEDVQLVRFFVGPAEVRLEFDRRATWIGWPQWRTVRNKVHVYLALLIMLQVHVILPAKRQQS